MKRFELLVDGSGVAMESGDGSCALDGQERPVDLAGLGRGSHSVIVDGVQHTVHVVEAQGGSYEVAVDGSVIAVKVRDPRSLAARTARGGRSGPEEIRAPMPGKVLAVHVSAGDCVESGQGLVVMEAMKMQNEIRSPRAGTVRSVGVSAGDSVASGAALVVVE